MLGYAMVFMGGFTVALNMTLLLPGNPDFEPSWIRVASALLMAVAGYHYVEGDY